MDSFKALGDHRTDAEQPSSFCGPIARAAGTVFLSGEYNQRSSFGLILHRRIVNAQSLAVGLVNRNAAFGAWDHQILDAHICERAPRHHPIVAPPRAVAVEVRDLYTIPLKKLAGGRAGFDCS